MKYSHVVFWLVVAGALGLPAGCYPSLTDEAEFACEHPDDCVDGYVCARGTCKSIDEGFCLEDGDCPDDDVCSGIVCEPVEEGFCSWSGDARCGPETYCFADEGKYRCTNLPCKSQADCAVTEQECFFLSEDGGICRRLGDRSKGDSCNPSREGLLSTPCERRLFCIDVDGGGPTCQSQCTPFDGRECNSNEACYPITASEGVCVDLVRQPSLCPDNGEFAMCDESSVCSGVNSCVQLCRLGSNDCADGDVCNHYLWPGETNIGACLAPCASDDDCTEQFNIDGLICLDDRCIQGAKCSPDDDDCTRGFSCGLNGYCQ